VKLSIDSGILRDFPCARIGWLTADVLVRGTDEYIERLKSSLADRLRDIGISADTMMLHPDISRWREVYGKMGVKPSKYRSSLESLLRRIFKGDIWSVSSVVDCYDCVSALSLTPMGAYDTARLKGSLTLRYGAEGEKFYPLGAKDEPVCVSARNVVYADDEKVCCWLWNYRDTKEASVSSATRRAIFIADNAFEPQWRTVEQALDMLKEELEKTGCSVAEIGVVDAACPVSEVFIDE
jgi:DNA/RNA-binding domain of Phe-tRNA-synthetase-like protein